MKYFDELNEVDTQVQRLAEMRRVFAVIINGLDSSTEEDIKSAMYYIEGSLDDISNELQQSFQQLWDAFVKDKEEKKKDKK